MKYKVSFLPNGITAEVEENTLIMEAARALGIYMDAPCGGNGTCGKCKVLVDGEELLACQTKIDRDMTVEVPEKANGHNVLENGQKVKINLNPPVYTVNIRVEKATIGGKKSDWEAVSDALFEKMGKRFKAETCVIRVLHETLAETGYEPEAVLFENRLLSLRARGKAIYAMAFDIGTTTVVGYLLDLRTGKELTAVSMLNPQSAYGADVIQRAGYSANHGPEELTDCIRKALSSLVNEASAKTCVNSGDIMLVTLVGNTCMSHLVLGISPATLTTAPYLPVVRETAVNKAKDMGFEIGNGAVVIMLPNIGGFVGADTVGAVLACSMDKADDVALMIDIGTNGELALGNKMRMESCSTAAGPAFEGALIECGMRGANEAIDHLKLEESGLSYSVIGGGKAEGICGSGLIDAVSELVRLGIVDESGRMVSEGELDAKAAIFAKRLSGEGPARRFAITDKVYITQKDIREVQLAKGAMAAGLKIMMQKMNVDYSDIKNVLIAGAFGNYMDPESACGISLIPQELRGKIKPVGNAAGLGSQMAALDKSALKRAKDISDNAGYIELAAEAQFQDIFVDELEF